MDQPAPEDVLLSRVNPLHLRQRLGLERDYEAHVFGPGSRFFHIENWYSARGLIRGSLKVSGLYGRARRNALRLRVRRHEVVVPHLARALDGYTLLQISDLHLDMRAEVPQVLAQAVRDLEYDACVLTGDFRFRTHGDYEPALAGLAQLRPVLRGQAFAVLGNHDSIRMVPGIEALGIRVLLNERVRLERDGVALHLAGIDDAHYYRVHNIEKAAHGIPHGEAAVLLSHTPEIYRHAAHAGFGLMLAGHTHGGQICLPGGFPIIWDAQCPRAMAAGRWNYHGLAGYTSTGSGASIVGVRLNCPPEVVLHTLRCAR